MSEIGGAAALFPAARWLDWDGERVMITTPAGERPLPGAMYVHDEGHGYGWAFWMPLENGLWVYVGSPASMASCETEPQRRSHEHDGWAMSLWTAPDDDGNWPVMYREGRWLIGDKPEHDPVFRWVYADEDLFAVLREWSMVQVGGGEEEVGDG